MADAILVTSRKELPSGHLIKPLEIAEQSTDGVTYLCALFDARMIFPHPNQELDRSCSEVKATALEPLPEAPLFRVLGEEPTGEKAEHFLTWLWPIDADYLGYLAR